MIKLDHDIANLYRKLKIMICNFIVQKQRISFENGNCYIAILAWNFQKHRLGLKLEIMTYFGLAIFLHGSKTQV